MNFASNIDSAQKSLAKLMNHRIEKLSTLLHANETLLNLDNMAEITIENENETRDDNSCSSTFKVNSLLMSHSKRSKANSSIKESTGETIKTPLKIHKRIYSKDLDF